MSLLPDGTSPDLPALDLVLAQPRPGAWQAVLRRVRRRRARAVTLAAVPVVLLAGVPVGLALPRPDRVVPVAHTAGRGYDGVCDARHDRAAPPGDG